PATRFAVLEEVLLGRLRQAPPWHGAIPVALDAFERADAAVKVRDLARRVGLSQRRFIQLFTAEVGLTPKLYGRVRRFQRGREVGRQTTPPSCAARALACRFLDHSHLSRHSTASSALTPLRYRDPQTQPGHIHPVPRPR